MWKEVTMAYRRYFPSIFQKVLRKTHEEVCHDSRCPGLDSNLLLP